MESIEVTAQPPHNTEPVILVIGKFDGLHVGHQRLLEVAKDVASSDDQVAVFGISEHPKWVLSGDPEFKASLSSYDDKLRLLRSHGVGRYYNVHFTKEYAKVSPEEFVFEHLSRLNIKRMVVGEGFRFGKGRSSNAEGLKELCQQIDVPVTIVPHVTADGDKVSSTTIRSLVTQGYMEAVQSMLGRPFELTGVVEKGEALGRELGFPTLNLGQINEYVQVKPGVYLGVVKVFDEAPAHYYTLISAGYRPTVNGDSYKVEAYLLNFTGDLYDQAVSVKFLRHLRDEVDFNGLDGLVEQMKQDERDACRILGIQSS